MRLLIESNADVNLKDRYGHNTLHYAVLSNDDKITKFICNSKASYKDFANITRVLPREFSVTGVSRDLEHISAQARNSLETNYLVQAKNIKKSLENPSFIIDKDQPNTKEEKIFNVIKRYEDFILSQDESDTEDAPKAAVYKKGKTKKKGKAKSKGKGKSKKGKSKKK